jgi:hypothetical protein
LDRQRTAGVKHITNKGLRREKRHGMRKGGLGFLDAAAVQAPASEGLMEKKPG